MFTPANNFSSPLHSRFLGCSTEGMAFIESIVQLVLGWYAAHELLGMFAFIGIEETGIPLFFPGDMLVIAAGARDRSIENAVVVCAVAALATSIGSSILYAV